uniref:Protein kinase domain-containing protein n=1 Tax=Denticeps clupeoides TaxID=299321 RepID=A0AAY4DHE5_9TELE
RRWMQCSQMLDDSILRSWKRIGSGGFGQIYRARHEGWRMDVFFHLSVFLLRSTNIKSSSPILHPNSCRADLLKEANLMRQGGNPYVLRIMGVYQGRPSHSASSSEQLGLVMEFMERGSLESVQESLGVALGMNFLHCLKPALLHLDLKPSNVLLDSDLNAKLTDFGLAKLARSTSKAASDEDGEAKGTIGYMPPEAFQASYKPTFASDVYSYGVLLWSIFTGERPYPCEYACSSVVRLGVTRGDRPGLENLTGARPAGLEELTGLMRECWAADAARRPSFKMCLLVTEGLWEMQKSHINDAVYQVQRTLVCDICAMSTKAYFSGCIRNVAY